MNKQRILIILVTLFIGIPLIAWGVVSLVNSNKNTNSVISDRDTGEVYDKLANNTVTGGSGVETGEAVLFGIEPYIEKLLTEDRSTAYINSVKQALWKFSDSRLNNQYKTLTLRPQEMVIGELETTGTIRLGQTDIIIPISIKPSTNEKQAIITINKNQTTLGGEFVYVGGINNPDNLLFSISQSDNRTSNLTISAYDGYREPALNYIQSLGYNVPDFAINFKNYENPFNEK